MSSLRLLVALIPIPVLAAGVFVSTVVAASPAPGQTDGVVVVDTGGSEQYCGCPSKPKPKPKPTASTFIGPGTPQYPGPNPI